jgi:hypothetical protein
MATVGSSRIGRVDTVKLWAFDCDRRRRELLKPDARPRLVLNGEFDAVSGRSFGT